MTHLTAGAAKDVADGDRRPLVEVHDLQKSFDGDDAGTDGADGAPGGAGGVLRGVDLTLYEGETTVLMGPNGTGKTVLLACIAGGLLPSSGEVRVFDGPPVDARSRLSFLLQGGLAVPELSGRETAAFFADLHPAATDRWRAIAHDLDLDDAALDRRVQHYSGGMVRKLELAVALAPDVPLYLLDEPTAELDVTTVDRFHALVEDLAAEGRTVVMTSHAPRDARAADRLVFVADGRIVADGAPERLREAVPPVVAVRGRTGDLRDHLRGGRLFETDAQRRGFLADGVTVDDLDPADVSPAESTYVDAFNYYVHVAPGENAR